MRRCQRQELQPALLLWFEAQHSERSFFDPVQPSGWRHEMRSRQQEPAVGPESQLYLWAKSTMAQVRLQTVVVLLVALCGMVQLRRVVNATSRPVGGYQPPATVMVIVTAMPVICSKKALQLPVLEQDWPLLL
jgi:hypothetical protein